MDPSTQAELAARLKNVLKEHQRHDVIGGADKLVASLVTAIQEWINEDRAERKSA
jgi:hypothetical protein